MLLTHHLRETPPVSSQSGLMPSRADGWRRTETRAGGGTPPLGPSPSGSRSPRARWPASGPVGPILARIRRARRLLAVGGGRGNRGSGSAAASSARRSSPRDRRRDGRAGRTSTFPQGAAVRDRRPMTRAPVLRAKRRNWCRPRNWRGNKPRESGCHDRVEHPVSCVRSPRRSLRPAGDQLAGLPRKTVPPVHADPLDHVEPALPRHLRRPGRSAGSF
jgi:hypothetical protein